MSILAISTFGSDGCHGIPRDVYAPSPVQDRWRCPGWRRSDSRRRETSDTSGSDDSILLVSHFVLEAKMFFCATSVYGIARHGAAGSELSVSWHDLYSRALAYHCGVFGIGGDRPMA